MWEDFTYLIFLIFLFYHVQFGSVVYSLFSYLKQQKNDLLTLFLLLLR